MTTEPVRRPTARRRGAVVLLAAGALLVPALPAAAWTGPTPHPAPPIVFTTVPSVSTASDGSALLLGADPQDESTNRTRIVRVGTNGAASLAPAFAAAFGQNSDANGGAVGISEPDASGAVLVFHRNTHKYLHLAKGQSPASATLRDTPDRIQHLDVNQSGAAAAIVGGGSTVSVYRRAAGPSSSWTKVPTTAADNDLDRLGQQRSYGIGITVDPNGGIYVVYETEQDASVLQAYAPPGGSFGTPTLLAHDLDPDSVTYVQSTNGHVAIGWDVLRSSAPFVADKVVVAVRRPGAAKAGVQPTLAQEPGGGSRVLAITGLGITDSGRVFAGQRDAQRVSGCEYNIHGDTTEYLATSPLGGTWTKQALPGRTWNHHSSLAGITTAGDHVRIASIESKSTGTRCAQHVATQQALSVRTTSGAGFGTPRVLVPFTSINPGGTTNLPIFVPGMDVGTNGHLTMVVQSLARGERSYDIFTDGPPSKAQPKAGTAKAPKNQKLKKKKVKATVTCAKAGQSADATCTATVKVKVKKGKKFKAAGKATVKVAAGKKKAVKVTVKKKARKQIAKTATKTKIRFVMTVKKKDATTVKVTQTRNVRR